MGMWSGRWHQLVISTLVLCCSAGTHAAEDYVRFADAPVGLAWSAAELDHIGIGGYRELLERAGRVDAASCSSLCQRTQTIFDRLLVVARQQTPEAAQLGWSLSVVRAPDVDAVSFPGGQVVVSEAFVSSKALGDEALAFVLAHEMAHSVLEHERQSLTFARMLLPRDVPRTAKDVYVEMDFNFSLLKSLEPMLQESERQADELGFLIASAAGFAPERQLEFLAREAAQEGASRRPMVSTHPPATQRLRQLQERLPLAERVFARASRQAQQARPEPLALAAGH